MNIFYYSKFFWTKFEIKKKKTYFSVSNYIKILERHEKCLWVLLRGKSLPTLPAKEWVMSYTANVRGQRMKPGIIFFPLWNENDIPGGRMSAQRSGKPFTLRIWNCPWKRMNHKLAKGIETCKRKKNTITNFPLKTLEYLVLSEMFRRWWDLISIEKWTSIRNNLTAVSFAKPRTC